MVQACRSSPGSGAGIPRQTNAQQHAGGVQEDYIVLDEQNAHDCGVVRIFSAMERRKSLIHRPRDCFAVRFGHGPGQLLDRFPVSPYPALSQHLSSPGQHACN